MAISVELVDVCPGSLERINDGDAGPVTKLGGRPALFAPVDWPACRMCGQPMEFIAQIRLDSPLALSDRYAMAYVFMCPGTWNDPSTPECETWAPDSGANAVILQAYSEDATPQGDAAYPDYLLRLGDALEPNVNTIDPATDERLVDLVCHPPKVGGVPLWLQNDVVPACPGCGGPTHFVAQLDGALDEAIPKERRLEGFHELNFGDAGSGYLFLCDAQCEDRGAAFLWQCC